MRQKPIDATIDDIIALCDNDIRGALRALMLINEHLELELHHLYALAAERPQAKARAKKSLH